MLSERYSVEFIAENLLSVESWRPFPPASDRAAWEGLRRHSLNVRRYEHVLAVAERCLATPWPVIPVSRYFDFVRSGNRDAFEGMYMPRRQDLAAMTMAACFSHEARHIEAAVDMMWAICEESSWAISAHVERRDGGKDVMPDVARPTVALFSCETAAVLAEASYLLGAELDAISPAIRERIEAEIERRILVPFEVRDDFHFLPFYNNWTPWCMCSILSAAAYVVRDPMRLAAMIRRAFRFLDPFLAHYPADFSCDEGPSYWGASPGALLMLLEVLYSRTAGAIDFYDEPAIAAMGRYFADMHLAGPWFFAYSDTPARMHPPSARVYRYGERIGDERLRHLVLLAQRGWQLDGEPNATLGIGVRCGDLLCALRELFWIPADAVPSPLSASPCAWYPEGQLLVAHETAVADRGLILAVKGGSNGENHNHIDVGEFMVYADGGPVIVDPGRGIYRRQNFTAERYTIWWNAGRGHDVLQFGDHEQAPRGESRGKVVWHKNTPAETGLELELAGTCAAAAGVRSWRRTCRLLRGGEGEIRIADRCELKQGLPVSFPLFTPAAVTLGEGRARFALESGRILVMSWDPSVLSVVREGLEDSDPYMERCWGTVLSRLICRFRTEATTLENTLSFRIEEGAGQ